MSEKDNALIYLKKFITVLANVPAEEWDHYKNLVKYSFIKKGDFFCEEGELFRDTAYISSGLFEGYYTDEHSGNQFIKKFYFENTVMAPYRSILERAPSDLSIKALEDSHIMVLSFDKILELYPRHVCWESIGRKFSEAEFIARDRREKSILLKTPTERYLKFLDDYKELSSKISDKKIAQYLGIANVSLSRIRKRLSSSD